MQRSTPSTNVRLVKELGGFVLEKQLGKGATAHVYLALPKDDPTHPVALKVFHPGFCDHHEFKRRSVTEFAAASSLDHPNIVRVLGPYWDLDPPAVALQYVEGTSLEDFQSRLPFVFPEASLWVIQDVLSALGHAHSRGVIHRDLKPANILVRNDGCVFVSDFGLAKILDTSRYTPAGAVLGSPDFMSPEQAKGDITSEKSDLFAAAAILYFLVTGTRPFARHTLLATLSAACNSEYEPVNRRNPKVSPALARIIHKGLSKNPDDRFANAQEFLGSLNTYLTSIGLDPRHFTLATWIKNPSDVTLSGLKAMAEALTRRAEAELAQGNNEVALETISQLSQVAPDSPALPRLMEKLEAGRTSWAPQTRRGRALAAGTLLAVLAGGSIGAWTVLRRPNPKSITAPQVAAQTPSTESSAAPINAATEKPAAPLDLSSAIPALVADKVAIDKQAAPPAKPRPKPKAPNPQPPNPTTQVRFEVPEAIKVYWNGRQVRPDEILTHEKPGYHELRLEKQGMPPIVQRIHVATDEPTIIRAR